MDNAGVKDQLDTLEAAWNDAIVSDDLERIAAFMADEWVLVSSSGLLPRATFLSLVGAGELSHTAMRSVGESRVLAYGDVAARTARVVSTAVWQGRSSDADEWTTDVFVRTDGTWRCVLTHITAVTS
jgi:ketosteroid isomerase-like protein